MRTLVTGGAGFIGSHLCDALIERGDEVWCIDNLHLGREQNIQHLGKSANFHFRRLDVLDRERLDRTFSETDFDVVFHMAANSDIRQGSGDHELDLRLTFLTTFETLEAVIRHRVGGMFLASTSAVFGDPKRQTLHECSGPLQPLSFYGAAKLASEAYLSAFVNSFGFRAWVLRIPNVVGERCTHGVVHDFIKRLTRDPSHLRVFGDGAQSKPYMYVKDLIAAIMIVFDRAPEPYAMYHVAGDGITSVRQIAEIVVEEMGLSGIPITYAGSRAGWVGDVPHYDYDVSKIRALGFRHRYSSTEAVRVAIRKILHRDPTASSAGDGHQRGPLSQLE